MKESLAKTLYDLVRAEQFVPFSILFASGQRLPTFAKLRKLYSVWQRLQQCLTIYPNRRPHQ